MSQRQYTKSARGGGSQGQPRKPHPNKQSQQSSPVPSVPSNHSSRMEGGQPARLLPKERLENYLLSNSISIKEIVDRMSKMGAILLTPARSNDVESTNPIEVIYAKDLAALCETTGFVAPGPEYLASLPFDASAQAPLEPCFEFRDVVAANPKNDHYADQIRIAVTSRLLGACGARCFTVNSIDEFLDLRIPTQGGNPVRTRFITASWLFFKALRSWIGEGVTPEPPTPVTSPTPQPAPQTQSWSTVAKKGNGKKQQNQRPLAKTADVAVPEILEITPAKLTDAYTDQETTFYAEVVQYDD